MAVSTTASRRQCIDLDIHTEACMTRMTCGEDGGAVSMWVDATNCDLGGILTTTKNQYGTGFFLDCNR